MNVQAYSYQPRQTQNYTASGYGHQYGWNQPAATPMNSHQLSHLMNELQGKMQALMQSFQGFGHFLGGPYPHPGFGGNHAHPGFGTSYPTPAYGECSCTHSNPVQNSGYSKPPAYAPAPQPYAPAPNPPAKKGGYH